MPTDDESIAEQIFTNRKGQKLGHFSSHHGNTVTSSISSIMHTQDNTSSCLPAIPLYIISRVFINIKTNPPLELFTYSIDYTAITINSLGFSSLFVRKIINNGYKTGLGR